MQTIAPSIPYPVFHPPYTQGTEPQHLLLSIGVKSCADKLSGISYRWEPDLSWWSTTLRQASLVWGELGASCLQVSHLWPLSLHWDLREDNKGPYFAKVIKKFDLIKHFLRGDRLHQGILITMMSLLWLQSDRHIQCGIVSTKHHFLHFQAFRPFCTQWPFICYHELVSKL